MWGITYAVAVVLLGLAVGAEQRAGVLLGAAPRETLVAGHRVGIDAAAGGEVSLCRDGGNEGGDNQRDAHLDGTEVFCFGVAITLLLDAREQGQQAAKVVEGKRKGNWGRRAKGLGCRAMLAGGLRAAGVLA
jgi:hypothetical protein